MKYIKLIALLWVTGYATEYSPWFTPPFEFQSRLSYLYENQTQVQTPRGSFKNTCNESSVHFGLGVTPWPNWNVETELFLTHTNDIPFSYEASYLTVRYAWMDDICGDWISLVTGVTLSFPGDRYLRNFCFNYHGNINTELHATIGKEWAYQKDWITRFWALGGWGIANKGSGWVHGLGVWEYKPISCIELGVFSEAEYGLGNNDIIPDEPFRGYASINHQNVDIGGYMNYVIPYWGTLTVIGWYNVYARNYIENYWGAGLSFLFPFSIL